MPDEAEAKLQLAETAISAVEDIEAILREEEWSVGMLEDIDAIVRETGIKHPNPPRYYRH